MNNPNTVCARFERMETHNSNPDIQKLRGNITYFTVAAEADGRKGLKDRKCFLWFFDRSFSGLFVAKPIEGFTDMFHIFDIDGSLPSPCHVWISGNPVGAGMERHSKASLQAMAYAMDSYLFSPSFGTKGLREPWLAVDKEV